MINNKDLDVKMVEVFTERFNKISELEVRISKLEKLVESLLNILGGKR